MCNHEVCLWSMYCCIACVDCINCSGVFACFLRLAVGVGLSGVGMCCVLIGTFILVLNCEVLWASLAGLGAV